MIARRAAVFVVAATALGALLRVPGLDSGLWFDEIVTLMESVRPPFREIVTAFPGYNNHPLYSLLAHLSVAGFGEHVWTIRLPAYLLGVAGIPLLYYVGVTLTTRAEAVMAATLLAVSYHGVWFSQNARGYTTLLFFTLLATLLFVRLLQTPSARLAIWYGVAAALGLYAHLTMAFVVMAHVIVWFAQLRLVPAIGRMQYLRTAVLGFGVAGILAGLLYLPMAEQVYTVLSGPRPATAAVATPAWAALEMLRGLRVGFGTVGVLAALGLVGIGGVSYLLRNPFAASLFMLPAAISVPVMLVAGMSIRPRFFFSLLGFGLLMLVRGAIECGSVIQKHFKLEGRRFDIGIALVSLVVVISMASLRYNYQYPKQDFGGALDFIERHRAPSERVATGGLAIYPYQRYYRMPWTPIERPEQLESLHAPTGRLWMVYSFEEYMDAGLVKQIRAHCAPQQTFPGTLGGGDVKVCTMEIRPG